MRLIRLLLRLFLLLFFRLPPKIDCNIVEAGDAEDGAKATGAAGAGGLNLAIASFCLRITSARASILALSNPTISGGIT